MMTIRELLEADPNIVALDITIRRDHWFVKEYIIGAKATSGPYWKEVGRNDKWIQYEEETSNKSKRRAISNRPINYQDTEGGSTCGCILKSIPKRILDLQIELLLPSTGCFFSSCYYRRSDFHGYRIDSPIDGEWKDLPEEKIKEDPSEVIEEEYLTDEDLLKPKEDNISFDDLLGGDV